jgi:hypothetical protein
MNSLPHGPLSLIVDFASTSSLILLPLFHTSINLKEIIETRKQRKLLLTNTRYFRIVHLAQGLKLKPKTINTISEIGNRSLIEYIMNLGCKPSLYHVARGGNLATVQWLCGIGQLRQCLQQH